ncbi:cytochrome d ubiquinol oxidase subunit II [Azospirillum griseum]|uniref:Cytochrome d ubiquinol oxidase subunit II n=1 Tax=Azospirillum griseum TaxID=2496639 RepID=A0A431VBI6_9PROT|nr:cytochrome d ubiquinol oxidase subunit II [Azospirillum griseum]RTR15864.1 cytochrome d ubiquinol oxidase subunit II [Azospirillum griseum]
MHHLVDYEILRLIWWLFLGVLLIGFAIMDGFDLGVAALLPLVARTDVERRVAINSIGPVWDGNQVWLILGAGAIFAAWPAIYAAAFSGFYIALFLVLATLILRPVGFEFRNKIADPRWRSFWDWALFAGGLVPSLVFGVAFGNLLQGVPFRIDGDLRVAYEGSGLFELLNPFGLLAGLLSLAMLTTHGAVYLSLKTEGAVRDRARGFIRVGAPVSVALFALAGVWVFYGVPGYALTTAAVMDGPSNPLFKEAVRQPGAWMANYAAHPWMMAAPALGLVGPLLVWGLSATGRAGLAFIASGLGIAGVVGTAGVSMFPFLMPSSVAPSASLTVWDASSSHVTLFVMLVATLIFLPIVLAYTGFIFRTLRGTVSPADVQRHSNSLY